MDAMVEAYYKLCGAVIAQAISDYKSAKNSSNDDALADDTGNRINIWLDAKDFLFTDRLEDYLEQHGIDSIVSPESIRKEALRGQLDLKNVI